MTDLDQLLPLWQSLHTKQSEYVLATVVEVEGSGYRKPGARMLIASDGRRAGTISGGCLEGEVARKAFWHTENGPVVRRYSTAADDGDVPFGMGCGGVVHLLLERRATAGPHLERLFASFESRRPLAIATALEGEFLGCRSYIESSSAGSDFDGQDRFIQLLSSMGRRAFDEQRSFTQAVQAEDGQLTTVWAEWCAARPGLFVFGAGDDAIPLVRHARQLGWYVAVADGRSNLATASRFAEAHAVHLLGPGELPVELKPSDVGVVMTHSLEQDTHVLRELLAHDPAYIGVLGPRRRTREMLFTLASELKLPESRIEGQVERWLSRLHAPMGLDLGGDTPAAIALAVIAEIQQVLHQASGLSLRQVRTERREEHRSSVAL